MKTNPEDAARVLNSVWRHWIDSGEETEVPWLVFGPCTPNACPFGMKAADGEET